MYLSWDGRREAADGRIQQAYAQWLNAGELVPWDPTYPVVAGFYLLRLRQAADSPAQARQLTETAHRHFQTAVVLAPNDANFRYNLGHISLMLDQPERAQQALGRATQLAPRNVLYHYYWLARAYQRQDRMEAAVTALTLQGLVDPQFLTLPLWSNPELAPLQAPVLQRTLSHLEALLAAMPTGHRHYNALYERILLLRWWHDRPLPPIKRERLTPAAYVALLGEREPQAAIARLNRELAQVEGPQQPPELLLLRAWLDLQQYLDAYRQAQRSSTRAGESQPIPDLGRRIRQHRDFKAWLRSVEPQPRQFQTTNLGAYTYRNRNIAINPLIPDGVGLYPLAQRTGLYAAATNFPAIFPRLDRRIDRLRSERLGLPHPTARSGSRFEIPEQRSRAASGKP